MTEADPVVVPLRKTFAGSTASINGARRAADRWLADLGADDEVRSRVALIVSELTSNAVQAAPGRPYQLSLTSIDESLAVQVSNEVACEGPPPKDEWGPDAVLALRGRGLAIVDALADRVSVDHSEPGAVCVIAWLNHAAP